MARAKTTSIRAQAEAAARYALANAYAPYSRFKVGAVVVADGRIHWGANVENASYPAGLCAERAAVAAAVADGCRRIELLVVAVSGEPVPPCGICLQTLREFAGPGLPIVLLGKTKRKRTTLKRLLPHGFSLPNRS